MLLKTARSKLSICLVLALPAPAWAGQPDVQVALDTVWVVLAGILVFFMNAGFGLLEAGFCRAKNTVNILAKNFTIAAIAGLAFYFIGFGLMFADGNLFVGTSGFMVAADARYSSLEWAKIPLEAKFFFQACFAMAAASIVSGAVAERIKFQSFLIFSLLLVAVVYGVSGHWIWGGGWLANAGFWDFAGSTQVHSLGGWAALTGAWVLGARNGKFDRKGRVRPIPGHSMALATTGGFILWVGWFGFNAGSTMAADPQAIAHIVTTTMLASFAGIVGAFTLSYLRTKTFDLSMMVNGCLAGLVGITAGCAFVSAASAVLIGAVAGALAVLATAFFDRILIDDPVGAISVHLVGGVWGTLAVGLFAQAKFSAEVGDGLLFGGGGALFARQLLGVVVIGAFVSLTSYCLWRSIKALVGLRVDAEEEHLGLDLSEMRTRAYYPDELPALRAVSPVPRALPMAIKVEAEGSHEAL